MKGQTRFHKFSLAVGALAVMALGTGSAFAAPHPGVGHFAGAHPAFRAGWHGRYGWYGPAWGGLALGLYFASLPLYYNTYWWGGVPYYYTDGTYYTWVPSAGEYVTVAPPSGLQAQVEAQAPAGTPAGTPAGAQPGASEAAQADVQVMAYPEKGQTPAQQDADKSACRQWASTQAPSSNQSDFVRAESACLAGRGYSVG
jgi:hypothetical protein